MTYALLECDSGVRVKGLNNYSSLVWMVVNCWKFEFYRLQGVIRY